MKHIDLSDRFLASRSGGPDDGPTAIRLGFAAEPVVDLGRPGGTPLYSECLARMAVGKDKLLRGGDFIDDLEADGSIGALDVAVVDLVLDELADDPDAVLGCNISPYTLANVIAWDAIVRRIGERALLAGRLVLEVTESSPLNAIADVNVRLAEVKQLGCQIAIDDFGAGYAAIDNLDGIDIEWDIVKIDRSFFGVRRGQPWDRGTLEPIVSQARSLAPIVVVEGIETDEHLRRAQATGAHYGQGWLFEAPPNERWSMVDRRTVELLLPALRAGAERRWKKTSRWPEELVSCLEGPHRTATSSLSQPAEE